MKLAVFSDTHGERGKMYGAVSDCAPDAVIHLGDYGHDGHWLKKMFPQIPVWVVRGNCDGLSLDNESNIIILGGVKIFLTHGHRFGVKSSLKAFTDAAVTCGARLALFGHTHVAMTDTVCGVTLVNPGAASSYGRGSYAEFELSDGEIIKCGIMPL